MTCDPIILRSRVPPRSSYDEYRQELRWDFLFLCAYCTIAETEAEGSPFHVDHYFPKKWFPEQAGEYWNLFYACDLCNVRKRDWYPSKPGWRSGLYIVRPDLENPERHVGPCPTDKFKVQGKTTSGEFTVERLDLNRHDLLRLRRMREEDFELDREIASTKRALSAIDLDRLPKGTRVAFLNSLRILSGAEVDQREAHRDLIRRWSRAPRLDPQPADERRQHEEQRQRRLEDFKVVGARLSRPDPEPVKRRRGRKK